MEATSHSLSELKANKYAVPETPCDKCFYTHEQCQSQYLACKDFAHYINKGEVRNKDRDPKREIFIKLNPQLKGKTMAQVENIQDEIAEEELIEKLGKQTLTTLSLYFENNKNVDIDKAKIACITYGLLLKQRQIKQLTKGKIE